MHHHFDKFIQHGTSFYQQEDFRGRNAAVGGINFEWFPGNLDWSGEMAVSRNGAMGLVSTFDYAINDQTEMMLAYRNYDPKFHSIFGNGFGDQSGAPQNESGWYIGLQRRTVSQ